MSAKRQVEKGLVGRKARFKNRKRLPPIYVDGAMFDALKALTDETGVAFSEYARRLFAEDLRRRGKLSQS